MEWLPVGYRRIENVNCFRYLWLQIIVDETATATVKQRLVRQRQIDEDTKKFALIGLSWLKQPIAVIFASKSVNHHYSGIRVKNRRALQLTACKHSQMRKLCFHTIEEITFPQVKRSIKTSADHFLVE